MYANQVEPIDHDPDTPGQRISMSAVADDSGANREWSKATPMGKLIFVVNNPSAMGQIEVGREYYVTVEPVSPQLDKTEPEVTDEA
jgi:hypothetical protein